ncbi:hypothetical protein M5K25_025820 [Dendrobium thyrsiflorum]|uniref:Uncharacterized protein n=1 Tax=Dendrobium thyrsiflorum TaxID=117978 RepID=A0ABD0U4R2_DENTH
MLLCRLQWDYGRDLRRFWQRIRLIRGKCLVRKRSATYGVEVGANDILLSLEKTSHQKLIGSFLCKFWRHVIYVLCMFLLHHVRPPFPPRLCELTGPGRDRIALQPKWERTPYPSSSTFFMSNIKSIIHTQLTTENQPTLRSQVSSYFKPIVDLSQRRLTGIQSLDISRSKPGIQSLDISRSKPCINSILSYLSASPSLCHKVNCITAVGSSSDVKGIILYTFNGLPPLYQAFKAAIIINLQPLKHEAVKALDNDFGTEEHHPTEDVILLSLPMEDFEHPLHFHLTVDFIQLFNPQVNKGNQQIIVGEGKTMPISHTK